MERANAGPLLELAEGLGALRAALLRPEITYPEFGAAVEGVYGHLLNFETYASGLLPLSVEALNAFRISLERPELRDRVREGKAEPVERVLLIDCLSKYIHARSVMLAELPRLDVYAVTPRGLFSVAALIERAHEGVPAGLRGALPPTAETDLGEAGKCLAFGLWTASGFHGLRAVESLILALLKHLDPSGSPPHRTWHAYIEALKKAGAEKEVTSVLDQIRDLHRNPLTHPEDVLDEAEAIALFGIVQSASWALVKRLPQPNPAPAPTAASNPKVPASAPSTAQSGPGALSAAPPAPAAVVSSAGPKP